MKISKLIRESRVTTRFLALTLLFMFVINTTNIIQAKSSSLSSINARQNDDFSVILDRITDNKMIGNPLTIAQRVEEAMVYFDAETGSFTDVDYASTAQAAWSPLDHITRLKTMVTGYITPDNIYYQDNAMYTNIVNALEFWYSKNCTSTNWWYGHIGLPQPLGELLVGMRSRGASKVPTELENRLLVRWGQTGGDPASRTGANKLDMALQWIYRACLQANADNLTYGLDQALTDLRITTEEGIQYDGSYFQHGNQLYIGGYGKVLIDGTLAIALYVAGTEYALAGEKLDIFSRYTRETYLRSIRGQYHLYNVLGRGITRPNVSSILQSGFADTLEKMKTIDSANNEEYDYAIQRLRAEEPSSYGIQSNNITYWRAEYTSHQRPGYTFDVRLASSRTMRNEHGNGEGLKSYFLTDGGTDIALDGDEYVDIFPVWDWTKIPGVTAPAIETIPMGAAYTQPGRSNYAGGVSDGTYGVTAYILKNDEYGVNTFGNKSWFFFDKEIVCLGAGINSTNSAIVNTAVNQALLKGDVTVSVNDQVSVLDSGLHSNVNPNWVLHNQVAYYFPKGGNISVSNQAQTGSWYSINTTQSQNPVTKDVFSVWFEHGLQPTNGDYAYIVVPNISESATAASYPINDIEILANTDSVQAVKHKTLGIYGVAFFKAATFTDGTISVRSDRGCTVLLKNTETSDVTVHIADPTQSATNIKLVTTFPAIEGERQLVCEGVKAPYAGSTKAYVVNSETPIYEPEKANQQYISVLEDSYVNGGNKADINYGAATNLIVKNENDLSYAREAYLKFSTEEIDASTAGRIYLSLNVSSANTSISQIQWEISHVSDNSWTESGLTWNNKPAATSMVASVPTVGAGEELLVDITSFIKEQKAAGNTLVSFLVTASERGDGLTDAQFISKENSAIDKRPRLIVDLQDVEVSTVLATEDTFVNDGTSAGSNFGSSSYILVKADNPGWQREAFIKFPLQDVSVGNSDKVCIFLDIFNPGVEVEQTDWVFSHVPDNSWGEKTITWNNMPTTKKEFARIQGRSVGPILLDVTALVSEQIKSGNTHLSINIAATYRGSTGGAGVNFYPRENADIEKRPKLIIEKVKVTNTSVEAVEDAHIQDGSTAGNSNYGKANSLIVKADGLGYRRDAFVKFPISELRVTGNQKAYISLTVANANVSVLKTQWIVNFVANNSWTETGLTWNNQPATTSLIATIPSVTVGNNILVDVTDILAQQINKGTEFLSIHIAGSDRADGKTDAQFYSRESGDASKRPTLIVTDEIMIPASTIWQPVSGSTDWSSASNWSNGVPGKTSLVTIPKSISYPVLVSNIAIKNIYFSAGAELGRQDLLTYEKAFVDYDFGTGDRSIHFRMLSLPLAEAYPGDFTFGGYPDTYIQTLQVDDNGRGKWATAAAGNTGKFTVGTGFILSLDPDNATDKGLGLSEGTLRLPFFDSYANVAALVHPNHALNTWGSTFTNPYGTESYTVTRTANAYRLAGASVSVNPQFGQSGSSVLALVGNPFMATIDFDKLYSDNANLIKNSYQVWTKVGDLEGYIGYSPEGSFGIETTTELNNLIAPLQGFVVEQNNGTTGVLAFNLPNVSASAQGELRSSSTDTGNKLDIVAKNEKASVRTFIAKRSVGSENFCGSDSRKLINELSEVPEIYTLKSSDKGQVAVAANITNSEEVEYPLGLATSYQGNITFSFSGMNTYEDQIFFTDKVLNKTVELTGLSSYEYNFEYSGSTTSTNDRFSLRMVSKTSSIESDYITGKQSLSVYTKDGHIHAISDESNLIREVSVYNLNGMALYLSQANASSYTTSKGFDAGVYIIRIKTDKGTEHRKVIINR